MVHFYKSHAFFITNWLHRGGARCPSSALKHSNIKLLPLGNSSLKANALDTHEEYIDIWFGTSTFHEVYQLSIDTPRYFVFLRPSTFVFHGLFFVVRGKLFTVQYYITKYVKPSVLAMLFSFQTFSSRLVDRDKFRHKTFYPSLRYK